MGRSRKPHKNALRKCDSCNDGKQYTAKHYQDHWQIDHSDEIVIKVNKKQLHFKRSQKDKLFPCACGSTLKGRVVRSHALGCAVCGEIAAKTRGDKPIDIRPPSDGEISDMHLQAAVSAGQLNGSRGVVLEPAELRPVEWAIHKEYGIVLCKKCRTVVSPKHARRHLKKEEHSALADPEYTNVINTAVSYVGNQEELLSIEQIHNWVGDLVKHQVSGPALPQMPVLALNECGFKCSGCGYATDRENRAKEHIKHSECREANANVLTNISIQRLGAEDKLGKWIHVETLSSDQKRKYASPTIGSKNSMTGSTDRQLQPPSSSSHWFRCLGWDILLEQLRKSGHQSEIAEAVIVPHESVSLESWLIGLFVKSIFEMEQQEITSRDGIHKEIMKSDRRIYDGGFIYLRSWYNYKSDDVKNKCIIAAVHMIYGLIQLNKSTEYADLLVQSDELRQAALDLSTLVSGVVENLDSSSNNNNSVDEEQDLMTAIHDKDYFTGLFYAIRIMRLLWITRKENTTEHSMSSYPVHRLLFLICWRKDQQIDPAEVRSIIDCLDCWARVTVDIHLQLQLSAWKANATQSEGADELDKDYCNLVTDLWRKVLEAAWEGAEEQQQYLDEDTTLENTRTKPTPIIQHTYLYIQNNQPTPFSALQAAKAAIDDELSGGE